MSLRSDLSWLLLVLLCAALFLPGLGNYPLLDPDEGRNAQVAAEMVDKGHWLPPTLEGRVRYQKPPLYYWLVAGSFMALGKREASARLPSALAAILGSMVVFLLGARLWGREKGILAALISSTSLIYVVYSHIVIFDMVLTFFILATLFWAWKGLEEGKKRDWALASVAMALAFLTKGPVGIIIPGMALLPLLLYKAFVSREPVSLPILLVAGVFILIAAPPFVAAELRHPGYCYQFFWKENVLRYFTPIFKRNAPFYYYLVVIVLGLMPWTFFLPRIFQKAVRLWEMYPHRTIFLVSWIALPTLFFSLAKSKMPHYILPTFPAWALLLAGTWEEDTFPARIVSLAVGLYLLLFLVAMPIYSQRKSAAFALPLMVKEAGIPVYTYRAGRAYSLSFYSGRIVENFQDPWALEQKVETTGRAFVLTRKAKLQDILSRSRCLSRILGTSPRYVFTFMECGVSPRKKEPSPPPPPPRKPSP